MNNETGIQAMKRMNEEFMEKVTIELGKIADNYYNDPAYIAKTAYNKGLDVAIKEVSGWESLMVKAFEEITYSNPKEAEREHKNTMNLLGTIKRKLEGRKL